MAKPNPKIAELQADIDTLTATINDPDTPEDMKVELRASVEEIQNQIDSLKKPKAPKPPKEKVAKPEVRFGDKSIRDASSEELEQAFSKRLERVNEVGGKIKTPSILSRNGQASSPKEEATASE